MTANEMKVEFNTLYDKIASASAPGYTDKDISVFLSKAQEIYLWEGFKPYSSFQENEKRRRDFDELITYNTPSASSVQTGVHPNGVFYDLPTNFLYSLKEEITSTSSDTCKNNIRVSVKPITEGDYNANINNPLKKPYIQDGDGLVWRMDFSKATSTSAKRHELITDGTFTVGTYYIRYIRKPQDIVPFTNDGSTTAIASCELPEITHRQLIEMAVRIATGTTNPQEYQLKVTEEKLNE